jgi:hypothetical protein
VHLRIGARHLVGIGEAELFAWIDPKLGDSFTVTESASFHESEAAENGA